MILIFIKPQVLIIETFQVFGLVLLVLRVLPRLTTSAEGAAIMLSLGLVPSFLKTFHLPKFEDPRQQVKTLISRNYIHKSIFSSALVGCRCEISLPNAGNSLLVVCPCLLDTSSIYIKPIF